MPANVDENLHVFEHMYMRVRANKCAYVTWYAYAWCMRICEI